MCDTVHYGWCFYDIYLTNFIYHSLNFLVTVINGFLVDYAQSAKQLQCLVTARECRKLKCKPGKNQGSGGGKGSGRSPGGS